jgi:hypothetical protein
MLHFWRDHDLEVMIVLSLQRRMSPTASRGHTCRRGFYTFQRTLDRYETHFYTFPERRAGALAGLLLTEQSTTGLVDSLINKGPSLTPPDG